MQAVYFKLQSKWSPQRTKRETVHQFNTDVLLRRKVYDKERKQSGTIRHEMGENSGLR